MFRRRRPRPSPQPDPSGHLDIAAQAEWYLAGRYLEHLHRLGQPIPSWAWINPLAHGTLDDLRALAARRSEADPAHSWTAAVFLLARSVLATANTDAAALVRLQSQVLAPLELELSGRPPHSFGPADLVKLVQGSLV